LSKSLSLKSMQKTLEVMENGKSISALYAYTPMLTFSYQHNLLTYNPFTTSPLEEKWSYNNSNGIGMGVFTISLSFSLDNYIPGSKSNVEIKNSKDQITQMKLQIQSAALDSEVEIINTLAKLENSIEQLEANKLNAELARKAYEMTSEAYQLGTKELLDVESAQNDLLSAEVAVLGVQLSYITELLNLEYTLNTSVEEIIE
ncbi:MAG: TolC family protein, partial [Spirochaetaceae bacterium]|nr:TolC family protein [Spirochaetaceae bacterium]